MPLFSEGMERDKWREMGLMCSDFLGFPMRTLFHVINLRKLPLNFKEVFLV